MRWSEIRAAHADQWLVVEALEVHSTNHLRGSIDSLVPVSREHLKLLAKRRRLVAGQP
jgi:hypothetical protein